MGGSGGGGGFGPIGPTSEDQCNITFDTNIFGPIPTVVQSLSAGDVLDVHLVQQSSQSSIILSFQGSSAGSLAGSSYLPTLVRCLQNGVQYIATIIRINGSHVEVRITRQ